MFIIIRTAIDRRVLFSDWPGCSHFPVFAQHRRPKGVTLGLLPDFGRGRPFNPVRHPCRKAEQHQTHRSMHRLPQSHEPLCRYPQTVRAHLRLRFNPLRNHRQGKANNAGPIELNCRITTIVVLYRYPTHSQFLHQGISKRYAKAL